MIEAEIPIAPFRAGRTIPRYPLEVVKAVLDQYVQEVPVNVLDLPADELPQTNEEMKKLLDDSSRWISKTLRWFRRAARVNARDNGARDDRLDRRQRFAASPVSTTPGCGAGSAVVGGDLPAPLPL